MTLHVIPWFRDFFVEFLKKEANLTLKGMGVRFEQMFVENTWSKGESYCALVFLDSEIEALTATDGWQRIYDAMKQRRKEGRNVTGRRWEYNYITYRLQEFVGFVRKLAPGVVIVTKRKKAIVVPQPVVDLVTSLKDEVECPNGCIPENFQQHKEAVERALDELQACLVLAGGRKIPIKELSKMTLAEAMFMALPNGIRIKASQISLPRTGPLYT